MTYRARLIDPGSNVERPVEVLGNQRGEMDRWAKAVLAKAVSDEAVVLLFMTQETQIGIVTKKAEAA